MKKDIRLPFIISILLLCRFELFSVASVDTLKLSAPFDSLDFSSTTIKTWKAKVNAQNIQLIENSTIEIGYDSLLKKTVSQTYYTATMLNQVEGYQFDFVSENVNLKEERKLSKMSFFKPCSVIVNAFVRIGKSSKSQIKTLIGKPQQEGSVENFNFYALIYRLYFNSIPCTVVFYFRPDQPFHQIEISPEIN